MLRRTFAAAAAVVVTAGFLSAPAFAADFKTKYYDLTLPNDWKVQKMPPNSVPAGTHTNLFASQKFGEGVLITIMPSDISSKEAAAKMAENIRQQGLKVIAGPVQIPGQNSYRFTYVSANKKMRTLTFVTGNGKNISQISILGRQGTQGTHLLKGLKPKEEGLFPKF